MTTLWEPGSWEQSRLGRLAKQIEATHEQHFPDYAAFWQWSIDNLNDWWLAAWRELDLPASTEPTVALADDSMPGAVWFPEITTSYAEAMLRLPGRAGDDVVVISRSQSRDELSWTADELRGEVARVRAGLVALGVRKGDRVAAYAPNVGETLIFLLAAASVGAIFCSVAPEFGKQSAVDRLGQIEPKVLLAVDGYQYGDKPIDRTREVSAVLAELPSIESVVHLPYLDPASTGPDGAVLWDDLGDAGAELIFDRVPFDHPLYVLFSSGTTGLPKPIMHGHGGITLSHAAAVALFQDMGPADRFSWFSTTGWMMWNYLVSGLLSGTTIVLFDGNPASPSLMQQWEMAAETGLTYYGTSAPFLMSCRKEGLRPGDDLDLSALRGVGSTGAPLPPEGFDWVYDAVSSTQQLGSLSGGTDICNAFVGATPLNPIRSGEIAARLPGMAVEAYVETSDGWQPVIGEVGEFVVTEPIPSMPVGFWGDTDGSRYHAAYFEDIPGVWRHGDWVTINENGGVVITGRSDATLNRGGVRLGTSEFYSVVEDLDPVTDSLVVHLEDNEGGAGELILLVSLAEGADPDDVRKQVATELRTQLSPRHIPDTMYVVDSLPRTLSGKKLEVPLKKVMRGANPDDVVAKGAITDPDALAAIAALRH